MPPNSTQFPVIDNRIIHVPVLTPLNKSILAIEVDLRDKLGSTNDSQHPSRARACLDALSQIQLWNPILAPLLQAVEHELELAIYSTQLTAASTNAHDTTSHDKIDKVPWFVLVNRTTQNYQHQIAQLNQESLQLNQKYKLSERDNVLLHKRILAMKLEIQSHTETVSHLNHQISKLNTLLEDTKLELSKVRCDCNCELTVKAQQVVALQAQLDQAVSTINHLTRSSTSSTDHHGLELETTQVHCDSVIPTPIAITELSIKQVNTIHAQLLDILNTQLDEYESELTLHYNKRKAIHHHSHPSKNNSLQLSLQQHLDQVKLQFIASVTEIQNELGLLSDHKSALQLALSQYRDSTQYAELNKHANTTQRKYSVGVLFSTDCGRSFFPNKCVPYCTQCHDRVVVCPHMPALGITNFGLDRYNTHLSTSGGLPWTIELPANTTHIQFKRPMLTIASFSSDTIDPTITSDYPLDSKSSTGDRYFNVIWHYTLIKRGITQPTLPRNIALDNLISLISEIYDARWEYESSNVSNASSFIEFFFKFMVDRFQIRSIANRVIFEVLAALEKHHRETNTDIYMFVRHLAGSDSVEWKYAKVVGQLITTFNPIDPSKFHYILRTMYLFRSSAFYDQLELEMAESSQPVTCDHICAKIKALIKRHAEPNMNGFHCIVMRYFERTPMHQSSGPRQLCESDFLKVVTYAFPKHSCESEACQQYTIAKHDFGNGCVSIERCGHIMAYICVVLCHQALLDPKLVAPDLVHMQNDLQSNSMILDIDDMRRIEQVLLDSSAPMS